MICIGLLGVGAFSDILCFKLQHDFRGRTGTTRSWKVGRPLNVHVTQNVRSVAVIFITGIVSPGDSLPDS